MDWSERDPKTGRFVKIVSGFCSVEGCRSPAYCKGMCKNHYHRAVMQEYRANNPEKRNSYWSKHKKRIKERRSEKRDEINRQQREWRKNLKREVLTHYSNGKPKCNVCGLDDIRVLCLDHINNDGAEQRRRVSNGKGSGGNSVAVYIAAKREGYPDDLQVLCCNCNRIKEYELKESIYV